MADHFRERRVPTRAARPRAPIRLHVDDLIARTGVRRDELATLAEIGALNAFGHDRRSALWQIERAVRPPGELFERLERCRRRAGVVAAAANDRRSSACAPIMPARA